MSKFETVGRVILGGVRIIGRLQPLVELAFFLFVHRGIEPSTSLLKISHPRVVKPSTNGTRKVQQVICI